MYWMCGILWHAALVNRPKSDSMFLFQTVSLAPTHSYADVELHCLKTTYASYIFCSSCLPSPLHHRIIIIAFSAQHCDSFVPVRISFYFVLWICRIFISLFVRLTFGVVALYFFYFPVHSAIKSEDIVDLFGWPPFSAYFFVSCAPRR